MRQPCRPPFSEFLQSTLFAYAADVGLRLHCVAHIRTIKLRGKGGAGSCCQGSLAFQNLGTMMRVEWAGLQFSTQQLRRCDIKSARACKVGQGGKEWGVMVVCVLCYSEASPEAQISTLWYWLNRRGKSAQLVTPLKKKKWIKKFVCLFSQTLYMVHYTAKSMWTHLWLLQCVPVELPITDVEWGCSWVFQLIPGMFSGRGAEVLFHSKPKNVAVTFLL